MRHIRSVTICDEVRRTRVHYLRQRKQKQNGVPLCMSSSRDTLHQFCGNSALKSLKMNVKLWNKMAPQKYDISGSKPNWWKKFKRCHKTAAKRDNLISKQWQYKWSGSLKLTLLSAKKPQIARYGGVILSTLNDDAYDTIFTKYFDRIYEVASLIVNVACDVNVAL